jgi:alpha-ribazole phosphatase
MFLTLVRHTRVDVPNGFIYGQTDVPLADSFEHEASEVVQKLDVTTFEAIYSSPLTRCRLLAERFQQNIQYDSRLMEMDFGVWEGKLWDNIENTSEATEWFKNYLEVACPGGESYIDLINRTTSFLNELQAQEIQNCCLVTHGGPIRAILSVVEGKSPEEMFNQKISYGEVIQIEIKNRINTV